MMKMESLIKKIKDLENIEKISKQDLQTLEVITWTLVLIQRHQLEGTNKFNYDEELLQLDKFLSELEFRVNQELYITASQGK